MANGVPGLEVRTALLFSEAVGKGRIDLPTFVALTATNAAKLYGLHPRKGTIAVGSDADLAIWDPDTGRRGRFRPLVALVVGCFVIPSLFPSFPRMSSSDR